MPRSLRIFSIFGVFLLVLIAIGEIPRAVIYPGREFISGAVDHLLIVVTAVLVGALLLWIVEESIEHHISPAIDRGLTNLADRLAKEVSLFPETFRGIQQVKDEEAASIKTPKVKELVSKGKIEEAATQSKNTEEQVAVLLQSTNPDDWREALNIVRKDFPLSTKYFLLVAFLFLAGQSDWRSHKGSGRRFGGVSYPDKCRGNN